jgi:hypothetical protein
MYETMNIVLSVKILKILKFQRLAYMGLDRLRHLSIIYIVTHIYIYIYIHLFIYETLKHIYHFGYVLLLNHLNPTCHVMHHQFNIQQLYVLPTLYLCVLYLSENKQRIVPLTA